MVELGLKFFRFCEINLLFSSLAFGKKMYMLPVYVVWFFFWLRAVTARRRDVLHNTKRYFIIIILIRIKSLGSRLYHIKISYLLNQNIFTLLMIKSYGLSGAMKLSMIQKFVKNLHSGNIHSSVSMQEISI